MKSLRIISLSLLVAAFAACTDKYSVEQDLNTPVYMDYATFRASVKTASTRDLVNPGKIYFKDNYLLIVEYREGVHVIDVSNPANPRNLAFVEIPGCVDIAVRNNTLYADSYVDVVAIDISDPTRAQETGRFKELLPYTVPPLENEKLPQGSVDPAKGVVVDWKVEREKTNIEQSYPIYYPSYPHYDYTSSENGYASGGRYTGGISSGGGGTGGGTSGGVSFGISGSMARFGLYDDYLYVMTDYQLKICDLNPVQGTQGKYTVSLNSGFETMFIHDGHIFFGTTTGMHVYTLETPHQPNWIASYSHIRSCDPVVVQDSIAYVTLRGGSSCGGTVNQLDIIKLSDNYRLLQLIKSYQLVGPYGVGIDDNTLFICDDGLKIYDVSQKTNMSLLAHFSDIRTYDVIPVNNYLFMIGKDGFYLYDYSDLKGVKQIGHIPVKK